jgi:hypothetical protein
MRPGSELPARIVDKIDVGDCWLWTGGDNGGHGYGKVWHDGRGRYVHIVVWECLVGPIPDGYTLDHLCRAPACCNPDHLEPVTSAENKLRGYSVPAKRARQTHCKRGHALAGANLITNKRGHRKCRTCVKNYDRGRKRS